MGFSEASKHYSLLTVGDGLAAQIPALLISVATGIIVTRSGSQSDLGTEIATQILGQKKAPLVAGAAILCFALIPGLPKIPFIIIGGLLFSVGWAIRKNGIESFTAPAGAADGAVAELPAATQDATAAPRDEVMKELPIDPLELGIGFGLVPMVDRGSGGTLVRRISLIRRQIAGELGMVIPPVRIHDEVDLDSHEYVCKVRGTEVARGRVMAGHKLAMDPGDAVGNLSGIPTTEPAFGLPAVWIADSQHSEAEALGYTVVDAESVIVTHLTETIRGHAAQLLTRRTSGSCSISSRSQTRPWSTRLCPTFCRSARSSGSCKLCCQRPSRSGISALLSKQWVTRRGSRATPDSSRSTRVRRWVVPLPPPTSVQTRYCARLPSIRRLSRKWQRRSPPRLTGSSSRSTRLAPTHSSQRSAPSPIMRRPWAACARCSCARLGFAATSGASSSRPCRTWRSAPTTRSRLA